MLFYFQAPGGNQSSVDTREQGCAVSGKIKADFFTEPVSDAAENNAGLDCGLLGENRMLAAQSMGLGTCCLGGPVRFIKDNADAKFFLDKLGFSDGYELIYILAVGYPDESPAAKPRDEGKVKFIK